MTLFTPSFPPRRKIKMSFLLLMPMLPSASARLRNGGMFISDARPRAAPPRPAVERNERRVMMFGIRLCLKLLFLETRQAHQKTDHAADAAIIGCTAQSAKWRTGRAQFVQIQMGDGSLSIAA